MTHCQTVAELATDLGIPSETLIAKITELRDAGELTSVLWDEITPEHDIAPEDIPTIKKAGTPATLLWRALGSRSDDD